MPVVHKGIHSDPKTLQLLIMVMLYKIGDKN